MNKEISNQKLDKRGVKVLEKRERLKRCPFCASTTAKVVKQEGSLRVKCGKCGSLGPAILMTEQELKNGETLRNRAIKKWNRRPDRIRERHLIRKLKGIVRVINKIPVYDLNGSPDLRKKEWGHLIEAVMRFRHNGKRKEDSHVGEQRE